MNVMAKFFNKTKQGFVALLCLLLFVNAIHAQTVSNRGKEFWVAYGHHQQMEGAGADGGSMDMVLYLATQSQAATVTVTIYGAGNPVIPGNKWERKYNIPANTVINTGTIAANNSFSIPAGAVGAMPKTGAFDCRLITDPPPAGSGGAGIFKKKAIYISSTVPIVAYSHIYTNTNSGASMLLPTEAWGYSYVSLNSKQDYASNCFNWTYVIAKEDNTVIEITPSVKTRAQAGTANATGFAPGVTKQITLQKGEIYQLIGANEGSDANGNGGTAVTGKELTGTKIRSIAGLDGKCKPIAVFAGSSRTSNPASCGEGGGDNDNCQLFPQQAWGKQYLTVPFSGSSTPSSFGTSTFKIAVADPTTIIRRNGAILTGLQNGNFYQYESNTPDYIESDKPIFVAQFMTGGNCLGAGGLGDPDMATVSPIEQGIRSTGFYRNGRTQISVNYISLVVPTGGLSSLRIDGSSSFDLIQAHPRKAGYSIVVKRWTITPATDGTQSFITCDSTFTGITYGLGSFESYAYNAGSNLENLSALPGYYNSTDTSAITTVHPWGFFGIPMNIGAYFAYKPTSITWKLSALNAVISSPTPPLTDITQNNPIPLDSTIIGSAKFYLYRLPGLYTFKNVGTFYLPLTLTSPDAFSGGCSNQDETQIPILIKVKPTASFTSTQTVGCGIDSTKFTSPAVTVEGLNVIRRKWYFTNNPADTSNSQNPVFRFPNAGSFPVKLVILTQYGGIDSITINVTVQSGGQPQSPYNTSATTVCLGQPITFTPTSAVAGTTSWWWNVGQGTPTTVTSNAAQTVTYTAAGTYQVRHTIIGTGASFPCPADTVTKTITVSATPVIRDSSFTTPTSCGGTDGTIRLNGLSTNTPFEVTYTFGGNTININRTSNDTGTVIIPNLGIGKYTNLFVKVGNCTSNIVDSVVLVNPNPPATPTASSNSPVCAETPLNLTATTTIVGTVSYSWTGPNGFASTTQNPVINLAQVANSGNYIVTLTQNGCTSLPDTVEVLVKPKPLISGTSKVDPATCATNTGSISLNGLMKDSVYTVAYTYNTNAVSTQMTANASGIIVIPNLFAGSYTNITVTFNGCISAAVASISLQDPNPPATPTINPIAPICAATTLTLNASSATAGVTYSWTGPNGFISSLQNPSITNASLNASGTYTVKAILNSCVSNDATVNVTIKVIPTISSSSSTNPTACATATGTIVLNGLTPNTTYGVNYTKDNAPVTASLSSNGAGTVTITGLASGSYSNVTLSSNGCNSLPAGPFNLADPNPPATPVVAGNISLCTGELLNLNASSSTAGVSYRWVGPNGYISNVQNPTIPNANLTATGAYTVTATLNSCTSLPAFINVVVNTTPAISSSSRTNPATCDATTGTIRLNGLAANTAYSVAYTKGSTPTTVTLTSSAAGVVTIGSLGAGTYSAISVTLGTCQSNIVGPLTISDPVPPATPTITNNSPLCADATLNLTSNSTTAGVTYTWTGPNGFTASTKNIAIPNATPAMSGTYTVEVAINNCKSTASTNVVINPNPVVDFTAPAFVCMPNGVVAFTNNSTITSGTINYSWNFGDGSPLSTATNPNKVYTAAGNYPVRLTATSGAGCSKNVVKNFNAFFSKPVANFKANPDTVCQGTTNSFEDLSSAPNSAITTRRWNFGDNNTWITSANLTQSKLYTQPGNYQVKLVVTNTQGCVSDTAKKNIRVWVQPIIDAGPWFIVPQGSVIRMNPTANDSTTVTFRWTPAIDFATPNVLRPSLTANKDQLYTLTATAPGNCRAIDTVSVKVLKQVTIPNAFSPNGDGVNDRWEIQNLGDYSFATVEIFNRYGQVVYFSNGYSLPWDGTMNGNPLPLATYYYIIKFNNRFPTLSGSVTIVR